MRRLSVLAAAGFMASLSVAQAQTIMMPANADMRAMQSPQDWDGSRSQRSQEGDPDARWAATTPSPIPATSADAASRAEPDAASGVKDAATDFRVDVWDTQDHVVETLAHCSTLLIGKAAFKEAAKERPSQKVTLRQGSLVVASSQAGAR